MTPVSLTSANAGAISDYHPRAINVTLEFDTGCVAILGGVEKIAGSNPLKVIPNPTAGDFRIELSGEEQYGPGSLEIYNTFGQKVFSSTSPLTIEQTINPGFLPSGIYEIRCWFKNSIYSQKLVIVH